MFIVQMAMKQPFSNVTISAFINLANPTLTLCGPNLHLPWHDLVVFFHDHFHAQPLQPLQNCNQTNKFAL